MAAIAGGKLASAVTKAGGLGIVGAGYGDITKLEQQMAIATGTRVGIGLINWRLDQSIVEAALSHQPAALWLSFGDSTPYIRSAHDAGVLAICQVSTLADAKVAAEAGADVLVAQGSESGGHGKPGRALFGLLPAISDAIPDVPLVAAGGISSAAHFSAATELGAAGVAVGTAYYATHEALDSDAAKNRLVTASGDDTVRGIVYDLVRGPEWPSEYDGRSLKTELTDRWTGHENELRGDAGISEAERHRVAAAEDDMSIRVVWAGEGVDAITEIVSAAAVTERFATCATKDL